MHATILADGQLRAANGAGGNRAARLTIDLDGLGKSLLPRLLANIEDVAASVFAFEIDQMDHALTVHGRLRLNAVIRSADESDTRGLSSSQTEAEEAYQKTEIPSPPGKPAGGDFYYA